MVNVTFISFEGQEFPAQIQPGYSLMEGAVGNGVDGIEAACGGNGYCGTCRVYVDPAWRAQTGEQNETEVLIIESIGDEHPGVRLSCQIPVDESLEGLVVRLPETQSF